MTDMCSYCGSKVGDPTNVIVAPWEIKDDYEGHKLSQRVPCPNCNPKGYAYALEKQEMKTAPTRISGYTYKEWVEFARRDDCLERMVPSDLRQILSKAKF